MSCAQSHYLPPKPKRQSQEEVVAEEEKQTTLRFMNGARCWNGPLRSTAVFLQCGAKTQILGISEPETCTYEVQLETPAVCSEADIPRMYGQLARQEL